MRTIIIYTLFVLTITTQVSCTNYLDVTPDNVATIDYAFRNRNEAENYLFTCYSTLQNGGMAEVLNNPGFVTSGEIIYPYPTLEQTLDLTFGRASYRERECQ